MEKTSFLNCQTTAAKVCLVRKEIGVDYQGPAFTLAMEQMIVHGPLTCSLNRIHFTKRYGLAST